MDSSNEDLMLVNKKKRLLKSLVFDDSEDSISDSYKRKDFESEFDLNQFKKSRIKNKSRKRLENLVYISQKENATNESGVLGSLLSSIREEELEITNNMNSKLSKNEVKRRKKIKSNNYKNKKKKNFESINIKVLLDEIDSMKISNKICLNSEDDNKEYKTNLTEIEKSLLNINDDFNHDLQLNEWLPSRYLEIKSEVINNLENGTMEVDNLDKYNLFYCQWIEQYGFLSVLTKDFTRNIHDCFLKEGRIPSIEDIKKNNKELFLDSNDDILISVQNLDGCVILNRLIQVANSQEKLIDEMNKELKNLNYDFEVSDFRIKFGVVSKKARTKLWWICRMAEHCQLIGREGKKKKKYVIIQNYNVKIDSFVSNNADINSSLDPTMSIFENYNIDNIQEKDHYEEDYKEIDSKENDSKNEMDLKWTSLSSMKISNRTRPWETRLTKNINVESDVNKDKFQINSKVQLFKFMLKNIGPRPSWTVKNSLEDMNDDSISIEIEPPINTSLREQSQLKIKWMQMYKQAEKLAIYHFKIIDAETKELNIEILKNWCKELDIELFIPTLDIPKIKNRESNNIVNIIDNNFEKLDSNIDDISNDKVIEIAIQDEENEKMNDISLTTNNSLPLEIEYISDNCDESNSSKQDQELEENKNCEPEIQDYEIRNDENDYEEKQSISELTQSEPEIIDSNTMESQELNKEIDKNENSDNDIEYEEYLEMKKEAYRKLKAIKMNKKRFKAKIMRKYGHLLEDEAEESDEDGVKLLKRRIEMDEEEDEDDDEDLDWDELSGFSDFIDDSNHDNEELNADAIQAHLNHIRKIEEKQYRQLFTLEGLKERKNKTYLFSTIQDEDIDGETRIEKKRNELLFNSSFFDDDVISELWTDEEVYDDFSEDIDEENLIEIVGIDYNEWQTNLSSEIKSSDETIDAMRREKYIQLKNALLKEASAQINLLKQRLHDISSKLDDKNLICENREILQTKHSGNLQKLRKLLYSIHSACNKCIYQNYQYFDHIDIAEYIKRRQKNKKSEKQSKVTNFEEYKIKIKNSCDNKFVLKNISSKIKENLDHSSDSDDGLILAKKPFKKEKGVVNIKGGRFLISQKQ